MDKRSLLFILLVAGTLLITQYFFRPKRSEETPPPKAEEVQTIKTIEPKKQTYRPDEKFYVLENEHQQLVFSNYGGAIAEINLPLKSKSHPDSVIHPVSFDEILEDKYPAVDHFPSRSYTNYKGEEITETPIGGYYPLLRRPISNKQTIPVEYYSMNISSDKTNIGGKKYSVGRFTKNSIEFTLHDSGRTITKSYVFSEKAPYFFDVNINVSGNKDDLWLNTGVCEVELSSNRAIPAMKYRITTKGKGKVENLKIPSEAVTKIENVLAPDWICNSSGFLGIIMDPLSPIDPGYKLSVIPGIDIPTKLSVIDPQYELYPAKKYPAYAMYMPLSSTNSKNHFRIFAGPFQRSLLKTADKIYADPAKGYNPDYIGTQSFHGFFSFISGPFSKLLMLLMNFFYTITHSWGIAIILLTIALRAMLYPLNSWSLKSNERMQNVAPKIKLLQERYKKDPKRLQMETMKLYKQEGVNPLSGCFPILIQLPFLIGLFDLLKSSFDLRGVTFIPGWINDLTAPDVLFSWSDPIFFLGTEFHFLPILIGIIMYVQQKMTMKLPTDKSQLTDQQKQQKMMTTIMPILLTFVFYKMPSGLNIYFLTSTLLGILQQWIIKRKTTQPNLKRVK